MNSLFTRPRPRGNILYSRIRHPVVCAAISINAITTQRVAEKVVGRIRKQPERVA